MTTLTAYRVAPNMEHKAAAELRQAGIKAYVPRQRNKKRNPFTGKRPATAPGYVIANDHYQPAFVKHVRGKVGTAGQVEIARLYIGADRVQKPMRSFSLGDVVEIKRGPFAALQGTVAALCKKGYLVDISIFGRLSRVSMAPQSMRKIHVNPG